MIPDRPRGILLWLPNPLGDVIMATPALRAVREAFASSRIAYVGRPVALSALRGTAWAGEMVPDTSATLGGKLKLIAALRRLRCDLGILLPNSFRVALLARLGKVRPLVGYIRDGRGWLLAEGLKPLRDPAGGRLPTPAIDYYLRLLELVGIRCDDRRMELPLEAAADERCSALLAEVGHDPARPMVMLNPGAAYGPSKMYPAERFAAVADALVERYGAQIVINAAPAEKPVAAAVATAMQSPPLLDFSRRDNSIGLLKSLAARCRLVITNDTGARHVAAAVGSAIVTIFGSTDPTWARIDYGRERIVRAEVDCSPCQKKVCPLPPGEGHHRCMLAIPPEQVVAAAAELLDAPAPLAPGEHTGGDSPRSAHKGAAR